MAVTQNELITALHTLLSTNPVRLAMRSGLASELDLADLLVGEIAVATDTLQVWVCTALGTCIQITGGLTALGYYATSGDLSTAHPAGTAGDIYLVGSAPSHLYTWGESEWVDLGAYNDTSTFAANGSVLHITGDETITGYKSVPTPTAAAHIARKDYVDLIKAGGSANAFTAMPYVGTAPVVASGTGYVKYADGTMICYTSSALTSTPNALGAIFYGPYVAIPFGQTFVGIPKVTTGIRISGGAPFGCTLQTPSTTSVTIQMLGAQLNDSGYVDIIAIGKWK